jgi:uncharacterized membrane protein YeaQ/YmgE (transglycosylase-associated protein family)
MNTTSLIVLALIGIVAGWAAGKIMKGRGLGLIGDLIVGVVGSFLGAWLFGVLHISIGSGLVASFVTALVGALVLLYVLRLIRA